MNNNLFLGVKPTWLSILFLLACSLNLPAQGIVIGTGTEPSGFWEVPVQRSSPYEHFQVVWTASELTAAGLPSGATLTGIGFSITESAGNLANYTISMGHTSQTLAIPMIGTGLNTVKNPFTYLPVVVPGGAYQMIPFDAGFAWNGTSNIVVNFCTGPNIFQYPAGALRYTDATEGAMSAMQEDFNVCSDFSDPFDLPLRPNVRFSYTTASCSGTPAPGNTIASSNPFCKGAGTLLGLQNQTSGSGVTYQWLYSADGVAPYANAAGTSNQSQYTATIAGFYKCNVTCSGNTGTSAPLQLTSAPVADCYCTPDIYYGETDYITNVTLSSLSNPNTGTDAYQNFRNTVPAPNLARGVAYPVSVFSGSPFTVYVHIYIDFNQDGDFEDADEHTYLGEGIGSVSGVINVPVNAELGQTGLRVISAPNEGYIFPCIRYEYANVEDYFANIIVNTPCAGAPAANAVTPDNAILCPGSSVSLGLQNLYEVTGLQFQWQKFNNSNSTFENLAGQTGTIYTATSTGTYRCVVTCTNSGQNTIATPATVINQPFPPTTTNNALHFDGTDDYVEIPYCGTEPVVNGGNAITVEYWFKGSNSQSAFRVESPNGYIVAAAGNNKHALSWDGFDGVSVGAGFNDGNWHHIAFTWERLNSTGFRSYLDGQLIDQRHTSSAFVPTFENASMFIGSNENNSEFTNGAIDELRIWNVARTQAEIQAGMCGVNLPQNNLRAYYRFDHGAAGGNNAAINTLANSVGAQFHGELHGFVLDGTGSNWIASTAGSSTWYADSDGDSYGDPAVSTTSCTQPSGYVDNSGDCNDNDEFMYPGAPERCNGLDDNCNGSTDEGNACCSAGILYVKTTATGANNGSSWENAYTDLQNALNSACPGVTQIWVAAGTYKPTSGTDRTVSFVMENNLAIYGGFNGTETALEQRNWRTHVTILSGDIGETNDIDDNSFHVVNNFIFPPTTLNQTAILDGFTITGGNANNHDLPSGAGYFGGGVFNVGASPLLANCTITGNRAEQYGGGVSNESSSKPVLTNCVITNNVSGNAGGAIFNNNSSPLLVNCLVSGNSTVSGGGMYNAAGSSPVLTNCVIAGNEGTSNGGGLFNILNSNPVLNNCIVWGNTESIINFNNSAPVVAYSIVHQATGVHPGTNNQNIDPQFAAPLSPGLSAGGNYRLLSSSPALNAGINTADLDASGAGTTTIADVPFDLDGNDRIQSGTVDMGSFESACETSTWYADNDSDGYGDPSVTQETCSQPSGYVADNSDCDDNNADAFPGAYWYADADLDGYGDPNVWEQICLPPSGYVSNGDDCDDSNGDINPGAIDDICNDIDEDCSGTAATDEETPTAVCKNITVNLVGGTASIDADQLDDGSTDNCGISFSASQTSFDCDNLGEHVVELTVSDDAGNMASCSATVTVNGTCDISISGTIKWEQDANQGVGNTTVALGGDQTASFTTGSDGEYTYGPLTGSNFTITPTKTTNKLNGLTSADATAIQQHVANINLLPAPFKRIAADVNKSNSITSLDATLINQALLGNPAALNQIKPWRFVPVAYTFPNPNAPWGFPETITLTGVNAPLADQDFKGIKPGDVVASWANPANFGTGEPLVLRVQNQWLETGAEVVAEFRGNQLSDLTSFQMALHFDPAYLELLSIEPLSGLPLSSDNFGTFDLASGEIRVVWSAAAPATLDEAAPLFRLRFNTLQGGGLLGDVLHLDADVLPAHAYNSALAESGVELEFSETTSTSPGAPVTAYQLLQNTPNPFTGHTRIGFVLPEAGEANLRVFDTGGRLLREHQGWYPVGESSVDFDLKKEASGLLYYELTTSRGVLTRKMLLSGN